MNVNDTMHKKNFFELFSLPESFNIDVKLLRENYRSLQAKFHPDQYSSGSESEKLIAVQMSSLLNDAFAALSSPVKRATYILQLSGINLQEDRQIDSSILIEQIAFRERLEELKACKDDVKENELLHFKHKIKKVFEEACLEFSLSQGKKDTSLVCLNEMKQSLSKMLFLDKLLIEIELALEEFD